MYKTLKRKIARTPFYPWLLDFRAFIESILVNISVFKKRKGTVYCIGPYKSGTTYFSQLFHCKSLHEPMQYTTIKNINNSDFLLKRKNFLDLDLECSGFFADRLALVKMFAPEAKIIYLSRHPEVWIGSVVNYFHKINDITSYNYIARLIFDPICGHPVDNFYNLSPLEQREVVVALIEYYIKIYSKAQKDENTLVVPLDKIKEQIIEIELWTGLKSKHNDPWKRENSDKRSFKLVDYIDISLYTESVRGLGYEL